MNLFNEFPAILDGSMLVLVYLVFQLPLLLAAGMLARRFSPRNLFEYLAVSGLLYTLFMTAIPGLLGLFGCFNFSGCFLASVLTGAVIFVVEREQPKLKLPPLKLKWPELLLLLPLAGVVGYQWRAYGLLPTVGTDALMYHLYYPAEWIRTGWVERISQPGIMTSSYPCYGELIYGWQMIGVHSDFFAKNYQFFFLLLAWFCTVAAGLAAGIRRPAAMGAGLMAVLAGINLRSCSVGNTDVMTGTFLLAGIAFLIIAARRNALGFFLLAGAAFGMSAGTKLLGTMLAPCAFLAGAVSLWLLRPTCRKNLLWGILTAILIAAPCFIANWVVTGNPVFPVRVGPLFANYMLEHSPAVGFGRQSWSFFVDGGSNSLAFRTAVLTVLFVAGAILLFPCRRKRFRNYALLSLGVTILLLLAIQLAFYPAITQPRSIIPLVMLAGFSSLALFQLIGRRMPLPVFALLLVVAAWYISSGNFDYLLHCRGLLLVLVFAVPLLWGLLCGKRNLRIAAAVLSVLLLILDGGYRFGASNSVASGMRRNLLGDAPEDARLILEKAAVERPLRIILCGAYYFSYMGNSWENILLSPPVTRSGGEHNWNYRTFEEARTPAPYPVWLERVRAARADYLLVSTGTFHALNPRLELDWALAHPEHFRKIYQQGDVTLFQVLEGK